MEKLLSVQFTAELIDRISLRGRQINRVAVGGKFRSSVGIYVPGVFVFEIGRKGKANFQPSTGPPIQRHFDSGLLLYSGKKNSSLPPYRGNACQMTYLPFELSYAPPIFSRLSSFLKRLVELSIH